MSGIPLAPDLTTSFADANSADDVRFIKVSIKNETLLHDLTIPPRASFEDDLALLLTPDVLQDNVPAYVLAKLAPSEWIFISYVPDSATVRDKMLYASTRASLLKGIGSTYITDSIFATSKSDLTPEAYASHKRHTAAPKPLSAREQEMADLRAAESGSVYEGSRARASHVGAGIGLHWSQDVEDAVHRLGEGDAGAIVVLQIDTKTETLVIKSASEASPESLGSSLPPSEPCYAFFAWQHTHTSPSRRDIIFIYSCPSSSPIKDRMVYSSGVSSTYLAGKNLLASSPRAHFASRKIETSDPTELDEAFLKAELGLDNDQTGERGAGTPRDEDERKPFAKPRGPARKR